MRKTTRSIHASICWCASATLALASAGGVLLYAIDSADQATDVKQSDLAPGAVSHQNDQPISTRLNTFAAHQAEDRVDATRLQHDRAPQHHATVDPPASTQAYKPGLTITLSQPRGYATDLKRSTRPAASIPAKKQRPTKTRQTQSEGTRSGARGKVLAVGAAPTAKRASEHRPTPEAGHATVEQTPAQITAPRPTEPTASKTEESDDTALVPVDLALNASVATTAPDTPPKTGQGEQPFDTTRIIGWVNIGYTNPDPAEHLIGRGIKQRGWTNMIERDIVPQLDWGTRRILVHNPFGSRSVYTVMQFDQFIEAQDAGLDWATQGFSAAWKRVVNGAYTDGEQVEVIGYLGSIVNDKEMDALVKAGDLDAWKRRAEASVAPLLKAGMSVGFDQGSLITEDHPAYAFLRSLQARGVKVYSETYPKADMAHLHDIPVIMVERYVKIVREKRHLFPPKQALGNTVSRLINGHEKDPNDPDWAFNHAVKVLADGDALITDLNHLIERGQTRRQVLERVERLSGAAYD